MIPFSPFSLPPLSKIQFVINITRPTYCHTVYAYEISDVMPTKHVQLYFEEILENVKCPTMNESTLLLLLRRKGCQGTWGHF